MCDYGQGRISSGPASLSDSMTNELGSNGHPQSNLVWAPQNSDTQVPAETGNTANNPSIDVSIRDALIDTTQDAAPDGSYGTLVLSGGGRSKYLGPTAGSEWLRDVCKQAIIMMEKLKYYSPRIKMRQIRRLRSRLAHRAQRYRLTLCPRNRVAVPLKD